VTVELAMPGILLSLLAATFDGASSSNWLVVPIVVPLFTAMITFAIGSRPVSSRSGWLGVGASVFVVFGVIGITWNVWHDGLQTHVIGNWPVPLGIALRADGLTCVMLLMSATVGSFVTLYALGYFGTVAEDPPADGKPTDDVSADGSSTQAAQPDLFWPLWMLLWSALNGLFLSGDIFNLYVTLELLTLAAIGMIVLAGTRAAVEAALRYLWAALAGSLFYLAGVVLLYGDYGTLDIVLLAARAEANDASRAALLLMMLGLMLKTALFPFHFWLPPAHGSAQAPVSALLSGLVVKGSFYILLRLWFDLFSPQVSGPLAILPAALGSVAIIWGSLHAFLAERLKMLVAYSTVAQVGYLFLVFGLVRPGASSGADAASGVGLVDEFQGWCAGILLAVSHGLAKGSLFLAAGTILRAAGHDRIAELPAVAKHLPITFFSMGMASVALMGLPPTAAFVGKWLLIEAAFAGEQPIFAVVIVLGGLLAAAYLFRVLAASFTDPTEPATALVAVPRLLEQTALGLALISLLIGLASAPMITLLGVASPWDNSAVESVEAGS